MTYDLVVNIETCYKYLQDVPITLVYYSHLPTAIISIIFSLFIFFKSKKSLQGKILLCLNLSFCFWLGSSFFAWIGIDSRVLMIAWALVGLCTVSFFIFSLYFVYVLIDKKDISFKNKLILLALLLLVVLVILCGFQLTGFDETQCVPIENTLYTNFVYVIELIILLWIVILLILKYRKADSNLKKQIIWLSIGIISFLLTFIVSGYISDFLYKSGYLWGYNVELSGIFMMTVFIGSLGYLIVKFKAFNVKLLGAQALVISLVALVGSEFFFTGIENITVTILISVTVLLSTIFGIWLVNSVKNEVKHREELERANQEISHRKAELQLMSDKLASANDQLRKLDNAKTEFISIASHQLRTPLTAAKGFVSLLLEGSYGKLEPKQEETLNKVYSNNERLIKLVEDLLNLSRMESGRMEFKLAPTQIEDICQEVIDTFVLKAKERNLYLDYIKLAEKLPSLMVDASKVREIVSNMTDNALKYTPKGGVKLTVEERDKNKDGGPACVRITLADTGIGISQEELPYLFAKFSRGKDTKRLNTGGTGLGLYVGKQMIENNGGTIWAESDGAGKGSRFIIELPIEQKKEILEKWG